MKRPPSLLILSHDVVGSQMAGPGIRYYQLARVLAREIPVVLATPQTNAGVYEDQAGDLLDTQGITLTTYHPHDWSTIAALLESATVALLPGELVVRYPQFGERPFVERQLAIGSPALVIDSYNPIIAEWLAAGRGKTAEELRDEWPTRFDRQSAPTLAGDFFLCASERQRDWLLGHLEAHGRINPATYGADPTLRQLVDVVPYGLPVDPPVATRPMIKGVWKGIAATDKVVLWGGGLWPWLDPLTAIHAIHLLAARPEIKLIFPGTRHPNKDVAEMPTQLEEAQALARHYGLLDRRLFFGDWVAYPDWVNVLLESDVALTLHTDSIETRLAFRSRVLEYIWAGLPVVATSGDATSDMIAERGLGIRVRPHDAERVAAAIVTLLDEAEEVRAPAFTLARQDLNWEEAAAPLVAFCRAPRLAPDRSAWRPDPALSPPERIAQLESEVAYWRALVTRYEQGRFMRTMQRLKQLRSSIWNR